jgi:ribonuclease BN (tRNA processing enzyme)
LLHDAQHTAAEFPAVANYGHSAVDYAVALAETADVGRLVLFHHDPNRTDEAEDAVLAGLRDGTKLPLDAAHEGDHWLLPEPS